MSVEIADYQIDAVNKMKNGCILCGDVGSGKSRTAILYYVIKVCDGNVKVIKERFSRYRYLYNKDSRMKFPKDLYIITTAKKRDSLEWEDELLNFCLMDPSYHGVKVTIDSWNNIKKYKDVFDAFFIFDEQRVVGRGAWVKTFLNISRKNRWILLTATPADVWNDYVPVFIANGFYRNRTDFNTQHVVFSPMSKYPKIERYINTNILESIKRQILVVMKDNRTTKREYVTLIADYNKALLKQVMKDRWDPYENKPIEETGKLCYLLRKVVNSDESRIRLLNQVFLEKKKVIVFYNYNYELDLLREYCESNCINYSEWNGQNHEPIPDNESWIYLVQYAAGSEGWNCIETDTVVFYSLNYSYRMTEQACGRIDRINTPYKTLTYYKIRSTSFVDLAINRSLENKKSFNDRQLLKTAFA